MRMAVFLPTKYNPLSTVFSNQIAAFLAKVLGIELLHEGNPADDVAYDVLFIVNYPFAFCSIPEEVARLVSAAKRIVWVENDYTIVPPKTNHTGPKSPIRKAFGNRKDSLIYWTNRPCNAEAVAFSRYVNWNMLAYQPCKYVMFDERKNQVVYYGAFRQGRISSFERLLGKHVTVACTTRSMKKFDRFESPMVPPLQPMIQGLAQYAGSLYLEDDDTHKNYHSPANRFYEALAAGTALLIDEKCRGTFEKADIGLMEEWIVKSQAQIAKKNLEKIAEDQHLLLVEPFKSILVRQILEAKATLCK